MYESSDALECFIEALVTSWLAPLCQHPNVGWAAFSAFSLCQIHPRQTISVMDHGMRNISSLGYHQSSATTSSIPSCLREVANAISAPIASMNDSHADAAA